MNDDSQDRPKYLYEIKTLKKEETNFNQILFDVQNHIKDKEPFYYDKSILEKKKFYNYT